MAWDFARKARRRWRAGPHRRRDSAQYFPGAQAADEASGREWNEFSGDGFVLESLDAGDAAYLPDLNRARAEAIRTIRTARVRSVHRARICVHARLFARQRSRRAGSRLSPKEIGSERSRCARWPRGIYWRTRCATNFCMRWWSSRRDRTRHCGCAKGLVEVWSEQSGGASSLGAGQSRTAPKLPPDAVNDALAHAATEAESEAAHRAAAWYAAQLLNALWPRAGARLARSGVPAGVVAALGQR